MKIYLSRRISGGMEDPIEAFAENCRIAREIGQAIKEVIPSTELYVPGGPTEEFVAKAFLKGFLTVSQIIEIDCDIIGTCDLVVCYVPEGDILQGGRKEEVEYARKIGKPVFIFDNPNQAVDFIFDQMMGHN